jgi:hypothetical protein
MAQVGPTAATGHFGSRSQPAIVGVQGDIIGVDRLPEARPAGAGVELRAGIEQRLTAADALVGAGRFSVPIRSGEGPFGAFLPRDLILLRRQYLPPLRVSLFKLAVLRCADPFLDIGATIASGLPDGPEAERQQQEA